MRSQRCFVLSTILSLITVAACTAGDAGPADDGGDDGGGDDTVPSDPVLISIQSGAFAPLAPYTGIAGQAIVARTLDGRTDVSLALSGLPPSAGLVGHVHAQPCAYQGGGHYKIDPLVADTVEANELWFLLETSPTGLAVTAGSFEHAARGDALSIVVHDAANGNAKMTCADLVTPRPAPTSASSSRASTTRASTGRTFTRSRARSTRAAATTRSIRRSRPRRR